MYTSCTRYTTHTLHTAQSSQTKHIYMYYTLHRATYWYTAGKFISRLYFQTDEGHVPLPPVAAVLTWMSSWHSDSLLAGTSDVTPY